MNKEEVNTCGHYFTDNIAYYIYQSTPVPTSKTNCIKLIEQHKSLISDLKQQLDIAEIEQSLIKLECDNNDRDYYRSYEYEEYLHKKRAILNKRRNTLQSITLLEKWLEETTIKNEKTLEDKYCNQLQSLYESQRMLDVRITKVANQVKRLLKVIGSNEIEVEK